MIKGIMEFYRGKKVLVTGHTGFKGSWMTTALLMAGAKVTGYALYPPTEPSLFKLLELDEPGQNSRFEGELLNVYGDVRDLKLLRETFEKVRPEIVLHMAAQPLVRESYENPVYTYETNVMGTVNVLECCRLTDSVKSVINVTTDKVYRNRERSEGYREDEELCGFDPYSNSKSCSELVTEGYRNSFFNNTGIPVTTMRAGNVIGGGDFAKDRIIPDCVRAAMNGKEIIVRNPDSTRPYQHVLEPVMAYLGVAAEQFGNPGISGCYNIGPDDTDAITTARIVSMFCEEWGEQGEKVKWVSRPDAGPHEAHFLKLDSTKIKKELSWHPAWSIENAMKELVKWYREYEKNGDLCTITTDQIAAYIFDYCNQ